MIALLVYLEQESNQQYCVNNKKCDNMIALFDTLRARVETTIVGAQQQM